MVASNPKTKFSGERHELVDWIERIPKVVLEPYTIPAYEPLVPDSAGPVDNPPKVEDMTLCFETSTFLKLKNAATKHDVKLNGALSVAFNAAFADLLVARRGKTLPLRLLGSYAVDLRGRLEPPLPNSYVYSVAGSCNVPSEIVAGADMWKEASAFAERLVQNVVKGEPFRLVEYLKTMNPGIVELFAVSFVFTNVGHYPFDAQVGCYAIEHVEAHLMGEGNHALIGVSLGEIQNRLCASVTYSPAFYHKETMEFLLQRFRIHVERLSLQETCPFVAYVPAE
jgi:hypothetical protein